MNTEKYNGWTNYETWNYALWIDNDEGNQNHWREHAREALKADYPHSEVLTQQEQARYALAQTLKDELEDGANYLLETGKAMK